MPAGVEDKVLVFGLDVVEVKRFGQNWLQRLKLRLYRCQALRVACAPVQAYLVNGRSDPARRCRARKKLFARKINSLGDLLLLS